MHTHKNLCEGAQDADGAACPGPNPTTYVAYGPESYGTLEVARWCDECVREAVYEQGWVVVARLDLTRNHLMVDVTSTKVTTAASPLAMLPHGR